MDVVQLLLLLLLWLLFSVLAWELNSHALCFVVSIILYSIAVIVMNKDFIFYEKYIKWKIVS